MFDKIEFFAAEEEGLCDSNPCKNGASCKENVQGGYDCLCIDFFSGPKCEGKNNSLLLFNVYIFSIICVL